MSANIPINILLGLVGASGAAAGLNSVRQGIASVGDETLRATAGAVGLAQVLTVAGAAAAGIGAVKSALDLGGHLSDLSARTGQSARDLVILERAFDNAGIGAGNVALVINRLQRAISGLNEMGESTETAFKRLGVSMVALRSMTAAQQIEALTQGFARIEDSSERTAIAMQLFGREGAQMLQIFGDASALGTAADEAGALGDRMQRNNAAFDAAGDRLSLLKVRVLEMAASATEQLLPALDTAAKIVKALDLGGAGATIGGALPSAIAAFALNSAMGMMNKLDDRLATWTLKLGPGMAQNIGFALTDLTGLLARILPIGLAAAVFKGIYDGALSAWQESINERDRLSEEAHRRELARIDRIGEARKESELAAERAKIVEEMKGLEAKRDTPVTHKVYDTDSRQSLGEDTTPRGFTSDEYLRYQILRSQLRTIDNRGAEIVGGNQAKDATAQQLEAAKQLSAELAKQAKSYQEVADKARFSLATDHEKLGLLDQQLDRADADLAKDMAAARLADDRVAMSAAEAKYDAAVLSIANEREATEKRIADTAERKKKAEEDAAKAAERAADAARQKAALEQRDALETKQRGIQRELMALDADFSRTDTEKWATRREILERAVAAAREYQQAMDAARKKDPKDSQAQANFTAADQGLIQAESALSSIGVDPTSFSDQAIAGITRLREEWTITAKSMAESMTGALASAQGATSNFLFDGLSGAQSWSDAWDAATLQVGQQFLRTLTDMVSKEMWKATVERGLVALGVTTHVTGEAAKTTATATGTATRLGMIVKEALASVYKGAVQAFEALSSIPYVGPILGAAAMAAAIAGGIALVGKISGHADGGYHEGAGWVAGPGTATSDSVNARLSNGEWVAPVWQTKHPVWGPMIRTLEAGRRGEVPGFSVGGFLRNSFVYGGVPKWALGKSVSRAMDDYNLLDGRRIYGYATPADGDDAFTSAAAAEAATPAAASGGSFSQADIEGMVRRESARNIHLHLSERGWKEAIRDDVTSIAREVFFEEQRKA